MNNQQSNPKSLTRLLPPGVNETGNRHQQRRADADEISDWFRRWPDANIGIVTGAVSGLVVLDIDPRHGGEESLGRWEAEHGPLPPGIEARTQCAEVLADVDPETAGTAMLDIARAEALGPRDVRPRQGGDDRRVGP